MNYERLMFTGIAGSLTFAGLSTAYKNDGPHIYGAAIIGLFFGLWLGYINQRDKQ